MFIVYKTGKKYSLKVNKSGQRFGANLLEQSHSSKDLVRIAFLRRKSHEKIRLKHVTPKRKAKTII